MPASTSWSITWVVAGSERPIRSADWAGQDGRLRERFDEQSQRRIAPRGAGALEPLRLECLHPILEACGVGPPHTGTLRRRVPPSGRSRLGGERSA